MLILKRIYNVDSIKILLVNIKKKYVSMIIKNIKTQCNWKAIKILMIKVLTVNIILPILSTSIPLKKHKAPKSLIIEYN